MSDRRAWFACVALVASSAIGACDPVHSNAVSALGDEAPGVRRGPLHRPGQPCLLCHDGAIGDPGAFTVAGTVFETPDAKVGANGATVELTDSTGTTFNTTTNAAGNFYLTSRDFTPTYPITRVVVTSGRQRAVMYTPIGRDGSCAGCHFDPAGADSPGHVSLVDPVLTDGGAP